jgi:hypothetical protein
MGRDLGRTKMVHVIPNRANRRLRQSRRRCRYQLPIERRAIIAAGMVREHDWTVRQASGLMCVNPGYVALVKRLDESDHYKLIRSELTLALLWRNYRRDLAERRAKLAAEHNAPPTDDDVDRIVTKLGPERVMRALDRATRPHAVAAE